MKSPALGSNLRSKRSILIAKMVTLFITAYFSFFLWLNVEYDLEMFHIFNTFMLKDDEKLSKSDPFLVGFFFLLPTFLAVVSTLTMDWICWRALKKFKVQYSLKNIL